MAIFFDRLPVDQQVSSAIAVHVDYGDLLPPTMSWQDIFNCMLDLNSELYVLPQQLIDSEELQRILDCL
ncbi:hypothetical protein GCM10027348_21880 [Hymenobacter tenuis]